MPTRANDPFIPDAPRRPISRQRGHPQDNLSETSIRTTTTAPSARRNLFAATLSRRPTATSSTTANSAHLNRSEAVLEDESEAQTQHQHQQPRNHHVNHQLDGRLQAQGGHSNQLHAPPPPQQRRSRPLSRLKSQRAQEVHLEPEADELAVPEPIPEFVVRDARGEYLHVVPGAGEQVVGIEDEHREEDARLSRLAREFWASGGGASGRGSRKMDEDEYEKPKTDIMTRLRECVSEKLLNEKWMFEPTDYMENLRVVNQGRL